MRLICLQRRKLLHWYLDAKKKIIEDGFAWEIDWQNNIDFNDIDESSFLREAAWVILSSGMRETIIRRLFPAISKAFYNWENADRIVDRQLICKRKALIHFNHTPKIDAIIKIAEHISNNGFGIVKCNIRKNGMNYIKQFPYMGPATSYHLAKNIGLQVAKPDRHLKRLAHKTGYNSPQRLCEDIAISIDDKITVVDIVIWRFISLYGMKNLT